MNSVVTDLQLWRNHLICDMTVFSNHLADFLQSTSVAAVTGRRHLGSSAGEAPKPICYRAIGHINIWEGMDKTDMALCGTQTGYEVV